VVAIRLKNGYGNAKNTEAGSISLGTTVMYVEAAGPYMCVASKNLNDI
jgi:hypothetical protein